MENNSTPEESNENSTFFSPQALPPTVLFHALEQWLDTPSLQWLLGPITDQPRSAQAEVAGELLKICQLIELRNSGNGIAVQELLARSLSIYDPEKGMTILNWLHRQATGESLLDIRPVNDVVLDALNRAASEAFGELLLGAYAVNVPSSVLSSPSGVKLATAIEMDNTLPTEPPSEDSNSTEQTPSEPQATAIGPDMPGIAMLGASWIRTRLQHPMPRFNNYLEILPAVLRDARSWWAGETVYPPAMAAMTGVLLSSETTIDVGWGILRQANHSDRQWLRENTREDGDHSKTTADNSHITSRAAGDIILVTTTPSRRNSSQQAHSGQIDCNEGIEHLFSRALQVRLAFCLSWDTDEVPPLIPVWWRTTHPFRVDSNAVLNEINRFARRDPTLLTSVQAAQWREWITNLDNVDLSKLGVAPTRLLQACSQRTDHVDALVDGVIALEALFGSDKEISVQIATSIARLLAKAGAEREALYREVKDLYNLRSTVVHGNEGSSRKATPAKLREGKKRAIKIAVQCLRTLIKDRSELIPQKSEERCRTLLLE